MSLETFGWILIAVGLFLFVYGYLKASKRIEVEDLPRVTEQEKREALAVLDWAVPTWSRTPLHDWEESGEL